MQVKLTSPKGKTKTFGEGFSWSILLFGWFLGLPFFLRRQWICGVLAILYDLYMLSLLNLFLMPSFIIGIAERHGQTPGEVALFFAIMAFRGFIIFALFSLLMAVSGNRRAIASYKKSGWAEQ